ncbi:MAG: hypothetical protein PHT92_05610 [Bacteroidales bacterium]|nr:hypothetical protein [Bacteroidales bacterium]
MVRQTPAKSAYVPRATPKSISIKDALEGKSVVTPSIKETDSAQQLDEETGDEDEDVGFSSDSDEEVIFSQIDLERQWQQFIQTHLSEKPRFASLLTTYQPVLGSNFQVKVVFESQLQLDMFDDVKNDVIYFLRSKLGCKSITIEASFLNQSKGSSGNGNIYTPEDRFKFLSQKNPKLLDLKQQLNLDFD